MIPFRGNLKARLYYWYQPISVSSINNLWNDLEQVVRSVCLCGLHYIETGDQFKVSQGMDRSALFVSSLNRHRRVCCMCYLLYVRRGRQAGDMRGTEASFLDRPWPLADGPTSMVTQIEKTTDEKLLQSIFKVIQPGDQPEF